MSLNILLTKLIHLLMSSKMICISLCRPKDVRLKSMCSLQIL